MNLKARLLTQFSLLLTGSGDLGASETEIDQVFRQAFDTGTGLNQAQIAFGDERGVNGSATDSIDLAGSLPGSLGGALTFTAVKEIFIFAAAANAAALKVGAGVSNAFVGPFGAAAVGVKVEPGGILHLRNPTAAGWAVVAGTGDILAVENTGGAAANFTIILIGEGS
jgi:hypothetical protein